MSVSSEVEKAWSGRSVPALASKTVHDYQDFSGKYLGMRAGMFSSDREKQARAGVPKDVKTLVMTAGKPDPNTIPYDDLEFFMKKAWETSKPAPLEYGASELLKVGIAKYLTQTRGREVNPAEIYVTSGNSGGLERVFRSFIDESDVCLVESPLWTMTVDLMKRQGADVVSVGMEKDGINLDELEQHILAAEKAKKKVKMIYLQPLNHNPTGRTITQAKAERLLRMAAQKGILIVSDEAYEPFFYGEKPPYLSALSGGHGVLTVHTFSKTLGTGLRLGWVHSSVEGLKPLTALGGAECSVYLQYGVGELLASGRFEQIIASSKKVYESKIKTFCDALQAQCGRYLVSPPTVTGGFFVWLELANLPAAEVHLQMVARGVESRLGSNMYGPDHPELASTGAPKECHIGLAFIGPSEAELVEAASRVGAAMQAVEQAARAPATVGSGAIAANPAASKL